MTNTRLIFGSLINPMNLYSNLLYAATSSLFDIAEEGNAAHDPVPWPDVRLKVDGADVVELGAARLTVDRALVQLAVLPCTWWKPHSILCAQYIVSNFFILRGLPKVRQYIRERERQYAKQNCTRKLVVRLMKNNSELTGIKHYFE